MHLAEDVDHNVLHVRFLLGPGFSPFGGCSTSSGCRVANTRGRLAGSHAWRSFSAGVPFIKPHRRHSCHVKPSGRIQSWSVIMVVPSMVVGRLLLMCLMTQRYCRGKSCCYNLLRTWSRSWFRSSAGIFTCRRRIRREEPQSPYDGDQRDGEADGPHIRIGEKPPEGSRHPRTDRFENGPPVKGTKGIICRTREGGPFKATYANFGPRAHRATGSEWIHELKWDGYRLVARCENGVGWS
jgi:hypothetical protein